MTLYTEIDWSKQVGGQIVQILPHSLASRLELQSGDELLAINGNRVVDVIDVQFYAAEEELELLIRRGDEYLLVEAERGYGQLLGLQFTHPTFDVDIRRCNNLCEFCFVLQMAPKFRRTLYIKDDDYRYSFLFGHFVTLTNLTDHDWWRIQHQHLSPLYISVHVTDWEKRRLFLRNPSAPDVMRQLRQLKDWGIEAHTQLVVVPQFNDGVWLERSIQELSDLYPTVKSISVVPVGLTKQHKYGMRPHNRQEAAETLAYLHTLQPFYLQKLGFRFVYPTDEWFLVAGEKVPALSYYDDQQLQENGLGMVRRFLDEWHKLKREIARWQKKEGKKSPQLAGERCTLVTATLFAGTLRQTATELAHLTNVQLEVLPIVNQRLGETITVAGLLMGQDVLAQLQTHGYGNLVVLPRVIFDHPDRISLDDLSPSDLANQLNCPIALADTMGDVWDALIGTSQAMFYPTQE